jgi:hypothetical protein
MTNTFILLYWVVIILSRNTDGAEVSAGVLKKYLDLLNKRNDASKTQCPFDHLDLIFKHFEKNTQYTNVLVHSPCLNARSMGNGLTNYLEARLCANITNMHYVALSKNMYKDDTKAFFSPIPEIIFSPNAPDSYTHVQQLCPCLGTSCHESPFSLLHQHSDISRDILSPFVKRHVDLISRSSLVVNDTDIWRHNRPDTGPSVTMLPAIPDVSIHYRCGDNDIGDLYGLLGFASIVNRIPTNAATIYVMTENPNRKTKPKQRAVCAAVLHNLHNNIISRFPKASVVILRGAPLYDDFSRLAASPITICSISTFCFWAGMAATQSTVYMPISKLLAGGQTPNYGPAIVWMNESSDVIVPGGVVSRTPVRALLQKLTSNY